MKKLVVFLVLALVVFVGTQGASAQSASTTINYEIVEPISWTLDESKSILPVSGSLLEPGDSLEWVIRLENSSILNSYLVDMGFSLESVGVSFLLTLRDGPVSGPMRPVHMDPASSKLVTITLKILEDSSPGRIDSVSVNLRRVVNAFSTAPESTVLVERLSDGEGFAQYVLIATGEPIAMSSLQVFAGDDKLPVTFGSVMVSGNRASGSWNAEGVFTFSRPLVLATLSTRLRIIGYGHFQELKLFLVPTEHSNAVGLLSGGTFKVPAANY